MKPRTTRNLASLLLAANLDPREGRDLLSHVLKKPTSYLIAHPETTLTPVQAKNFTALATKRRRGVPYAYLTGHQGFYGLDFFVTNNVLIPRPETEQLVDWVLGRVKKTEAATIVDVGTGSGCIAVTLARYLPKAHVIASDLSEKALVVAKKNARANGVSKRIAFRRGSLLACVKASENFDLVVANLPYLTKAQLKNVPHEPKLALHGGTRGLALIEKLITQIIGHGIASAILEIDPAQKPWLTAIGDRIHGYRYEFLSDLAGRTRFFILKEN